MHEESLAEINQAETKTIILDLQVIQTDSDSSASTHPNSSLSSTSSSLTRKYNPNATRSQCRTSLHFFTSSAGSCTSAEIERKFTLPASPRLILLVTKLGPGHQSVVMSMCVKFGECYGDDPKSPLSNSSSPAPSTPHRLTPVDNNWHFTFDIPWSKMPSGLIRKLENKERPTGRERREMICLVVGEVLTICPTPGKKPFDEIARKIVSAYPLSFRDVIEARTRQCNGILRAARTRHRNGSATAARKRHRNSSANASHGIAAS
ncbi:hypothetical protein NFI96_007106 [Prochilodus magdalenae]|nr:hypothetical protein NFI96_007106 [Prochilodus magdalenae]